MYRRPSLWVVVFLWVLMSGEPAAQAQQGIPADAAQQIDQVAASIGSLATAPAPATLAGQEARWRAESAMTSAVIGSIMRHPGQHREIVSYATARAPALRDVIVAKSVDSFPGFADSIQQSANLKAAPPPPEAEAQPAEAASVAGLPEDVSDPIEGFNRGVFWVNDLLDTWIFRPIAWTYGFIMPDFIKEGVRNGFDNFNSPVILANDILQLEFEDAAVTTGRLIINSTIGIVGLFDVASEWGLPGHHADFGQTMHSYGIGPGPYLVVPVIGPTTLRDGIGFVGDIFLHPRTYLLDTTTNLALTGGNFLVVRENLIEPLDDLKENSLDYYAAVRSAYVQNRAVELNRGAPLPAGQIDDIFDEDPFEEDPFEAE